MPVRGGRCGSWPSLSARPTLAAPPPVLCSDGRPYELTLPHMADRDSEAARIRAGGGFVTYNGGKPRVAGILQVRAGIG